MLQNKIIAVDFDGCIVTDRYPEIGDPILQTIYELKKEIETGAKLILWTCRSNARLDAAVEWCANNGIHFDAVNSNLPEAEDFYGGKTVKVYAHEYWDDRAKKMPPGR